VRLDQWLPRRSRTRLVLIIVAAVLLAGAVGGCAMRYYAGGRPFTLAIVAATPYVLLAAPVALLLMLLARQWIGLAVAALVTVLAASTQLSLYISDEPPSDAVTVRVMTSNLRLGQADASEVVAAVRRHSVDVLMLEELTAEEEDRLEQAGLDRLLPYHSSKPLEGGAGTGLWSRYPMTEVAQPDDFTFAFITAQLAVPGVARPVRVVALHAAGPVPDSAPWSRDVRRFVHYLPTLSGPDPMIVGGDFNATPDTVQFRDILDAGFADAADQAGAGYTRTYPADRWYPSLIAIDHVLSRNGPVATDVSTVTIKGSDHRALVVRLAVPRG
jgi:endonuclease/exonuclease/phosphatase (EEP) superfamily protein YafD